MKLSLLTLCLFAFSCIQAQSRIYGQVIDTIIPEGLPFASVLLYNQTDSFSTFSDYDGYYSFDSISNGSYTISANSLGYITSTPIAIEVEDSDLEINLEVETYELEMSNVVVMTSYKISNMSVASASKKGKMYSKKNKFYAPTFSPDMALTPPTETNAGEDFIKTREENTSTFSIDVDKASYSLLRKSILDYSTIPDSNSIRIEEMINYFNYVYASPENNDPFSVNTEIAPCKWNDQAHILQIGLQGKELDYENLAASNLVFLVDVSGSMSGQIDLIQKSLKKLVAELDSEDRISIVTYAGNAGLVLPSTAASESRTIIEAINNLESGGSTAGGAGIKMAYKIAKQNFIESGNNRVILCTDGDFNVGVSSSEGLEKLITEKKKTNIFLTVCGFGGYNYQDERMEQLADKGNGNYYFIDRIEEAEKVFVKEMRATLFLIAKDVKIQLAFNEEAVESYRLIGYANRKLDNEDFKDDKKDAGELGAGHQVTALYEIILAEDYSGIKIAELNLRYKTPDGDVSSLISNEIENKINPFQTESLNFRLANIVSSFGIILSELETTNEIQLNALIKDAKALNKEIKNDELSEFIHIVEAYSLIKKTNKG